MKKVIFVIGCPCSGKSTYIKNNFSNIPVIDLWDFQNYKFANYDNIYQSYVDCLDALLKAVEDNDLVILEHTLLLAKRRLMYIEPLKERGIDIDCICMYPSFDGLKARMIQRDCYGDDEEIEYLLDFIELPTKEEGFSNIMIKRE